MMTPTTWEVPESLATWAGCPLSVLAALKSPLLGDEKAILTSLRILGKAASNPDEASKREGAKPEDAFAGICKAIQQVLGNETGADRRIFLSAIDLCQQAIAGLSPLVSGLDVNMHLGKTFPILLDRTSLTADVKIAVASDKLVQQLAKHPKVGCEAVTKMVISAVGRADRPMRPLVLLRTLLGDFGLRLCAQRDVVQLLLGAVAMQLERSTSTGEDGEDADKAAAFFMALRRRVAIQRRTAASTLPPPAVRIVPCTASMSDTMPLTTAEVSVPPLFTAPSHQ
jgi:hypothetical protein